MAGVDTPNFSQFHFVKRKVFVRRSIGSLLLFLGAGSVVLHFIGYEFKLLMWIDNWGETAGWVIRGAMMFMASSDEENGEEEGEEEGRHEEQEA